MVMLCPLLVNCKIICKVPAVPVYQVVSTEGLKAKSRNQSTARIQDPHGRKGIPQALTVSA